VCVISCAHVMRVVQSLSFAVGRGRALLPPTDFETGRLIDLDSELVVHNDVVKVSME
jgi:hypothetical protein